MAMAVVTFRVLPGKDVRCTDNNIRGVNAYNWQPVRFRPGEGTKNWNTCFDKVVCFITSYGVFAMICYQRVGNVFGSQKYAAGTDFIVVIEIL